VRASWITACIVGCAATLAAFVIANVVFKVLVEVGTLPEKDLTTPQLAAVASILLAVVWATGVVAARMLVRWRDRIELRWLHLILAGAAIALFVTSLAGPGLILAPVAWALAARFLPGANLEPPPPPDAAEQF
jgi:hypothetical protein